MSRAYHDLVFTPAVRDMQSRMGSRAAYARQEAAGREDNPLGPQEAGFIAERDHFYQATVGETGWPYVQFRGGPAGFLKVLDPFTLGYADFRGNRQYISAGNAAVNDRVSLILVDYANRRRLKILGRIRLAESAENPALMARLALPEYRARIERAVLITVEASEWNCPQHIVQRYTLAELDALIAPLREELDQLRSHAKGTD